MLGLITRKQYERDMESMRKSLSQLQSRIDKLTNRISPETAPPRGTDPRQPKGKARQQQADVAGNTGNTGKGGNAARKAKGMSDRQLNRHYLNKFGD